MTRRLLITGVLILVSGFSVLYSQQLSSFSEDPEAFIEEVNLFMGTRLNEETQQELANFQHFWLSGVFSVEEQLRIIRISNAFLSRRARPVPHFIHYLSALFHFKQINHDQASYDAWESGLLSLISDRRVQLREVDRLLKITIWMLSENTLFQSSVVRWVATADDFRFHHDSTLFVSFDKTDLICYAQRDSGTLTQTSGTFNPVTTEWEGKGGKVNWIRAGFDEANVFAELLDYKIDMTKSQYRADSVYFTNSFYFSEPLLGELENKITRVTTPQRAIYPRFNSYTKRFVIDEIYDNVDFEGGVSMQGAKMNGSGDQYENALLKFYRNDTLFMKVGAQFLVFMSDRVSSINTEITIYLQDDSIYHPRIALIYNVEDRELSLYRTDDVMMRTPYFSSYHSLDMDFELLEWKIDEPIIKFTMAKGAALGQATFESSNFFNENHFYRIQALDATHPLVILQKFGEYYYSDEYPVEELAKFLQKPTPQIIQLCIRLSTDGFVYFDEESVEVTLKQKLHDYLDAYAGKIDYDVIDFVSNTTAPLENASLDLRNMELTINGVPEIHISDSQNVAIYPREEKIVLRKNRNFSFDGKIQAGLFTFFGEDFAFDYDTFKINLNNIDSLSIAIQEEAHDQYGYHFVSEIENIIELITGELLIDDQQNKSGLTSFQEYPIFRSNQNSYVYYENSPGLDSIYPRDSFYFELEPYTVYHLDRFTKEDVAFKGRFESGDVFPTITQTLVVQKDNSLGFEVVVPEEGIPIYGGKGLFYDNIDMSNKGLRGKGKLTYLSSITQSENFMFYPDSMHATATGFQITKSETNDLFPMVQAENVAVKWYPNDEEWLTEKIDKNITMFDEGISLNGSIRMNPTGLAGSGTMIMPDANLAAKSFNYGTNSIVTDTADFFLKSMRTDGYSFIAENVSSQIDFQLGKGLFSCNTDTSLVKFPENEYVSTLNYFNWNMEVEELAMGKKEKRSREMISEYDSIQLMDARLEQPTFVSINPRQDSLGFVTDSAIFNLRENLITAYNVNFIEVADALVFPYEGKVDIENRAQIRTLEKATIMANQKHRIHSANVNILNKNDYTASGVYNYIDENQTVQMIEFDNILVHEPGYTTAQGSIIESENFTLNPAFEYIGDASLDARREFLTFTGGARIVHNCGNLERKYIKFTAEIDPENIMIPVPTEPRDINNNRIFNGHFISNDSTHIYSALLSRRKIYSDNPISTAEGFIFFDQGSGKYKISSREKLADENNTGNLLTFNTNSCELFGEGKLNLAVDYGQFSMTNVGNINHNLVSNVSELELIIGLNFFFLPEAFTLMVNEIDSMPTLEGADLGKLSYRKGIEEIIGKEKARALREETNLYGRVSELPPELQFTILLTHVNLVWNDATSSYQSVGKIGIGNILNTQLNVMVDGHLEIQKKRSGDLFDVYLQMDDNHWYYFSYSRGVLQSSSSNREYNQLLTSLNENQRRLKVKSGETSYIYMVAVAQKLNSFLSRFRRR